MQQAFRKSGRFFQFSASDVPVLFADHKKGDRWHKLLKIVSDFISEIILADVSYRRITIYLYSF